MSGESKYGRESVFGNSPDARYFVALPTHDRVLSAMVSALRAGSALQGLVSAPGLGKTILLRRLVEKLPEYRHWFYRMPLRCSASEFYRYLANELNGGRCDGTIRDCRTALRESITIARSGYKGLLLIFDEAQCLSDAVFAELQALLQDSDSGAQIVLSGQPKLLEMLNRPDFATLQSAFADCHILSPLTAEETVKYITERSHLDAKVESIFSREEMLSIAQASAGVPRVIDNLCWEKLTRDKGAQCFDVDARNGTAPIGREAFDDASHALALRAPHRQEEGPHVHPLDLDLSEAIRALMQNVVSWTGTSGELLGAIWQAERAAALTSAELIAHLSRERQALCRQGIDMSVRAGDGVPTLISLRKLTRLPDHDQHPVSPEKRVAEVAMPATEMMQADPGNGRSTIRWSLLAAGIAAVAITVGVLASTKGPLHGGEPSSVASTLKAASPGEEQVSGSEQSKTLPSKSIQDPQTQPDTGIEHLRSAAIQGDAESQYRLALVLEQSDKLEAYKWLVLSHSAGVEKSLPAIQRLTRQLNQMQIGAVRYDVALAYAFGRGAPIDLAQAYKWMALAKAAGIPDAERQLDGLSRHMSAQQIAIASKGAEAWLSHKSPD